MAILFYVEKNGKKYPAHISTDNSKTGLWSVSFLAGADDQPYSGRMPHDRKEGVADLGVCGTCPGTCPGCYAMNLTRYDEPLDNYIDNTIAVTIAPREFVLALENALYSGAMIPRYFRLQTSGEFPRGAIPGLYRPVKSFYRGYRHVSI